MKKIGKLYIGHGGYTLFYCPGCQEAHAFNTERWHWNGDHDKPTLTPSVLVTGHDGSRCHSFVKEGDIQFLTDCTHAMAGQTVPLPDWPDTYEVT